MVNVDNCIHNSFLYYIKYITLESLTYAHNTNLARQKFIPLKKKKRQAQKLYKFHCNQSLSIILNIFKATVKTLNII